MRLGSYSCLLTKGTKVYQAYLRWGEREDGVAEEIHRHRYEVSPKYAAQLQAAGLKTAASNPELGVVEMVELAEHPWYVGTQSHPEFLSKPTRPHPLFLGLVQAAVRKAALESR